MVKDYKTLLPLRTVEYWISFGFDFHFPFLF